MGRDPISKIEKDEDEAQNYSEKKPLVDIFVNPFWEERRRSIIKEQQNKAENFFTTANM